MIVCKGRAISIAMGYILLLDHSSVRPAARKRNAIVGRTKRHTSTHNIDHKIALKRSVQCAILGINEKKIENQN